MRTFIVYESEFGNTKAVAEAVAAGFAAAGAVEGPAPVVTGVEEAPPLQELAADLLVVGAPTHAFGLSRPGTREDAHQRGGAQVITGVREWLEAAETVHLPAATFDTHLHHAPGSASGAAAKRLRKLGCELVADPEKFYVEGTAGPLLEGEAERARQWGAGLARVMAERGSAAGRDSR
ncbi:hypothetical protein [Kribbia dieselivorans]|uniref:hypothetical protein n=1 Tax=Kribbia dieselivorans TaxID=331526 RepID=UPI0008383E46|nr:hypothetical protein [Kribbia dieselivorans]